MANWMAVNEDFIDELASFLDSDEIPGAEYSFENAPLDLSGDLCLDMLIATDALSNDHEHKAAADVILREKETKRRRVYRQKLKDERAGLLSQVEGLTLALNKMKRAALDRTAREDEADRTTNGDNCHVGKWKTLAVWEWGSLCRAQDEQKRLQAAVSTQAKLIKDLQKVVSKRISKESDASCCMMPTFKHPEAVLFSANLQELDMNYARIDEVFRSLDVNSMAGHITNSTRTNSAHGGMIEFQHVNKSVISFDFLSTCRMFWDVAALTHRQLDRESYGTAEDSDNTIAVKYRVSKTMDRGATVSMRQRLVVRRYVQQGCFVVLWKIFVEGEGIFQGMYSDESGWCRLRPPTSQVGTAMEMLVRRSPMYYRSAVQSRQTVSQFDEFLRGSTQEDQRIFMQTLHQLLMDNALKVTSDEKN